jgi:DNA-binding transcriptional ArsR family regulator
LVADVDVIEEPKRARALLDVTRLELLQNLTEPASAAGLARRLELPRQRVNYHLRELESQGLVELEQERRRGNAVERIYRRASSSYAISTAALGSLGTRPQDIKDRFSTAYQIALASQAVRDLGLLQAGAEAAGKQLPTLSLDVEVRFGDGERRDAFAAELTAEVARLVQKYQDDAAPDGRTFQFYLGAYPRPKSQSSE